MKTLLGAAFAVAMIAAAPALAAPYGDPDWPCFSRLIPKLSGGAIWSGPTLDGLEDWRAIPAVAAVVGKITPRRTKVEDGEAAIAEFAKGLGADKAHQLTLVFAGVLDNINDERSQTIDRIKEFSRRQRAISDQIAKVQTDLDAVPPGESDRRTELTQQKIYAVKAFENAERTVRYACEIPTDLEARLGAYARALQAGLPPS